MPREEKIPLKTFWDAVEERLTACSADELRAILRGMAQETPPTERQAFLDQLNPVGGETAAAAVEEVIHQEDLLTDLDDFAEELQEEMEGAEYWEERHGWEGWDEEDSLGPYEEFVEPLTELFDRTAAVFDYGDLPLARAAYGKLFEVLVLEDNYGRGVREGDLEGVDAGEARARYLRAVYETEPPERRPVVLWEQMQQVRSQIGRSRPRLEDLLQISPRPLPDRDPFLTDWIAFLREQSGPDAEAWLREAIRLSQGTQGLEELARAEGKQRPRAYLDWVAALEQEGQHAAVLAAAQEALQTLPANLPLRAAIADHLCSAAVQLNEPELLRLGRWEAFAARPILLHLLDLRDAVPAGAERTQQMQQAAQHLQDYLAHPPQREVWEYGPEEDSVEAYAWVPQSTLAQACLFAEDWDAAHQLAASQKVLGWSSSGSSQGLVVSSFLALLVASQPANQPASQPLPPNLAQLWRWGLQTSATYGVETQVIARLERAYPELFSQVSWSRDQQEKFLAWCLEVAKKRVEAIVGGQHRNSYDKAAVLTAACVEVLRQRGNNREADAFLNGIRTRFPRHRAFQTELNEAVRRIPGSARGK